MSITDELMEWARRNLYYKKRFDELTAIANRIDEAHKHAIGYVDDRDPETMAENGWVRLPKDGNGEYVHVGDVMAYADNTNPMQVVALVPPSVFMVEDGPRFADMCRHYHAPTVEDVLYEMCDRLDDPSGDDLSKTIEDFVAEYAAKLQLRED